MWEKSHSPTNADGHEPRTSRKVAVCLRDLRRLCDRNAAVRMQCPRHPSVTRHKTAKEQGSRTVNSSIRPLALGFDPQMSAAFWHPVVSRLQRFMKSLMSLSAVWVRSVEKRAFGGCLPDGSRVSTHRMGKGSEP
jgi:hypothetical protein